MELEQQLIASDGTKKYRFKIDNNLMVEAAYFKMSCRTRPNIVCVSTQVGCAMNCKFCASSQIGFFRNLSSKEIIQEIRSIIDEKINEGETEASFEISFMGMGEPLANLANVRKTIKKLHKYYPQISRVSLSTVGPAKNIKALAGCYLNASLPTSPKIHLQISLHATDEGVRHKLIPQTSDSPTVLIDAGKLYNQVTGDKVCLNYILLKGINDSPKDAEWLSSLDSEIFYIKITQLNLTADMPANLKAVNNREMLQFCEILREKGMPYKVFIGNGLDIGASCGQMAAKPIESFSDYNYLGEKLGA